MVDEKQVEKLLERRFIWYEKNFRIRAEDGQIVPFRLKEIQKELEREAIRSELAKEPCYLLVLKARQEGVSTWAEAYLFRMAYEEANTRVLVTAHTDQASRNIFGMAKRYHENLPIKCPTLRSATNALHLKDNDSEFIVQTAGSGSGAGRSYTFSGWHGSECDLWPDAQALFIAVMQAVPKIAGTIRILESTSEGPGFLMHELWGRAKQGRGNFKALFFPWFADPKYTKSLSWDVLIKCGPSDWVVRNRDHIEVYKEQADGIRGGSGGSGKLQEGDGSGRGSEVAGRGGKGGKVRRSKSKDGGSAKKTHGGHGRDSNPAGRRNSVTWGSSDVPRFKGTAAKGDRSGSVEGSTGFDGSGPVRSGGHWHSCSDERLLDFFRDSLTDEELGLLAQFDVTYEQLNMLRWLLEVECNGDENKRKREYPSRAEECFEASGGDVLDQSVLAEWWEDTEKEPAKARVNMIPEYDNLGRPIVKWQEDRHGVIDIFEWPKDGEEFVLFLDCAQGTSDGDWTVGYVMNVITGEQAAEYRAKQDPDVGADQIELLAMLFNKAYVGVEVNGGYGWPFISHLSQRIHMNGLRLYERTAYDRQNGIKVKVKRPGWDTSTRTRPLLVAASKEAVRKRACRIRSRATIEECQTLYANMGKGGKIEARPGKHDDGWIAYSGANILRNELLGQKEEIKKEVDKEKYPLFAFVHQATEARRRHEQNHMADMDLHEVAECRAIEPESLDERRSYV